MCGIAGLYQTHPTGSAVIKALDIENMCMAMHHRGPNHQGIRVWGQAALGYRRLSIIDLSENGQQPMTNAAESFVLVFNGEIYNYQALQSELRSQGVEFKSKSDTEVVLRGYEAWGTDVLTKLEGMFVFAIYHPNEHRLLIARDPFGIKPLYYTIVEDTLAFASEVRSLLTLPSVNPAINQAALFPYMTLGYVPQPQTLFEGIVKLPPAHYIEFKDGKNELKRYFSLAERPVFASSSIDTVEKELEASITRSLVSDVPLGVFLSGGLDSSLLAYYSQKARGGDLATFSIGFKGYAHYDESEKSAHVAHILKTDHSALALEADSSDVLNKVVNALEEPIADPSIIPTYHLCAMTKGFVTVALSGEGGDELFAGYNRYLWEPVASGPAGSMASLLAPLFLPWLERMSTPRKTGVSNLIRRLRKFMKTSSLNKAERYLSWFALVNSAELQQMIASGSETHVIDPQARFQALLDENTSLSNLQSLQYVDVNTMLVDNLLLKADKIGMHHSLELRVPLLNRKLAQMIFHLPDKLKISGRSTKHLERQLVAKHIDNKIANQSKKGFEVPIGDWLRGDGRELLKERLHDGFLGKGLFDTKAMNKLINGHLSGARDSGLAIFALIALSTWIDEFAVRT